MFNVRCLHLIPSLIAILLLTGTTRAEDGISVSGSATVKAKPTEIDIIGIVSGEGELANDASVKFHDTKKKALAALDNLKNADLSVASEGSDIHDSIDPQTQMRMMQGQTTEPPKVRTQITEKLNLKLKNVDKLDPDKLLETILKLVDTSRDAGLTIGPAPITNVYQWQMQQQNGGGGGGESLVQFKIPDTTELQTQACKQAIADARAKAQRIADLTGVKLGKVLSVHDYSVTDTAAGGTPNGQDHAVDKEAVSSTIGDIPITVHLQVQFEIEKQ
jgi:uncharacterized protein YggE